VKNPLLLPRSRGFVRPRVGWFVVARREEGLTPLPQNKFESTTTTTTTTTASHFARTRTTRTRTMRRRGILPAGALIVWYGSSCPASAFSPSDRQVRRQAPVRQPPTWSSSASPLHLVPEQGNQLVAAYTAALSKYHEEEHRLDGEGVEDAVAMNNDSEIDDSPRRLRNPTTLTTDSSRNFVQRAFSLPSLGNNNNKKKKTKASVASSSSSSIDEGDQHDIVLFPLVGFTFCRNGNQVVPLPTQSNVSCRLPRRSKVDQEQVYGWYSPVCKLNMYATNEDDYCTAPNTTPTLSSSATP